MNVRWFFSSQIRKASELSRQVDRLIEEQRDLLTAEKIAKLQSANNAFKTRMNNPLTKDEFKAEMAKIEKVANELFIPYPHSSIRENVKEIAVAMTTILAFTTFFLQLTKIPTGSMQPTLFGEMIENHRGDASFQIPNQLTRLKDYWVHGVRYFNYTAPFDGELYIEPAKMKHQRFLIGGRTAFTVWFPPEKDDWSELQSGMQVHAGEPLLQMKAAVGDHLLVDRLTYNFRHPKRGEIFVFKTRGIDSLKQDYLYIKRLVALGGETVRIGNDSHLIIDGKRLDAATRHFESVYTHSMTDNPRYYVGHVNGVTAQKLFNLPPYLIAPLFPDESTPFVVRPKHYLAMGDNTLNSADSRSWGDLPERNVIGKCWFVYWPFTSRFGWGYR